MKDLFFNKNLLIIILFKTLIFSISIAHGMNNSIIIAHIIPIEGNEDGTFYPGDSFLVNYTIYLPSGGVFYDSYGNPCKYYYSLDYVEVFGEDIIGDKSIAISDIIKCYISLNASSGIKILNIEAHGKCHYLINETIWSESPMIWSMQLKIKVVDYSPCFSTFIYLLPGETTYRSKIVLLIRYDGNSHNLMQRASIDSYDTKTMGLLLNKIMNLISIKDLILNNEINSLDNVLQEVMLNGPIIEEFHPKTFTRENRYAKYIFSYNYFLINEEYFEKFNISISLYWSRFSNFKILKSLELYNMAFFAPLEVIGAKKVYVYTLLNGDMLLSTFQEPPEDEWFYEEWINDVKFISPLSANTFLVEGEGRVFVPRILSCRYNITVELNNREEWISLDLSSAFLTIPAKPIIINTTLELNITYFDYNSYGKIKIESSTPIKNITIFSKDAILKTIEVMKRTYYDFLIEKPKESTTFYIKVVDIWGNSKTLNIGEIKPYKFYELPYDAIIKIIILIVVSIFAYEVIKKSQFLKLIM